MSEKNTAVDSKPASKTTPAPAASGQNANPPAEPAKTDAGKTEPAKTEQLVANEPAKQEQEIDPLDAVAGILATSKSRKGQGGVKIRPNIGYVLIAENLKNMVGQAIPPQEQIMMKLLTAASQNPKQRVMVNGERAVPEPILHQLVVEAHKAGVLETRQDAWHIFRYYRTAALARPVSKGGFNVLKEVTIPIVAAATAA